MRADGQLLCQFAATEDFYSGSPTISQARFAQDIEIDARAFIKLVQSFQIDREITNSVADIIEPALGNAADERHLAALEADPDGTARAGCLPFAAAPAGL